MFYTYSTSTDGSKLIHEKTLFPEENFLPSIKFFNGTFGIISMFINNKRKSRRITCNPNNQQVDRMNRILFLTQIYSYDFLQTKFSSFQFVHSTITHQDHHKKLDNHRSFYHIVVHP